MFVPSKPVCAALFKLLVVGQLSLALGQDVIYSEYFNQGQYDQADCNSWNTFRAALTGNFVRVEYGGTYLSTQVLNDPTGATNLATLLRTTTYDSTNVGGVQATTGICGGGVELLFGSNNAICGCATDVKMFRPCIGNGNFGGLGSTTCGAESQQMTIGFFRGATPPPTPLPTNAPTPKPSAAPSTAPTHWLTGGAGGDPHFKTWHGAQYDFHGHCDLVLLNAPHVADGHGNTNKGLSIHIRSSPIKTVLSYISDVAIRIGDDVLEVGNGGKHYINGVLQTVGATEDLAGYKVSSSRAHKKPRYVYKIHLETEEIDIREYKNWITISIIYATQSNFGTSVGLMGRFEDGAWIGRDNVTVHTDINEYGQDWQVQGAVDGFLFRVPSPHPKQCDMPSLEMKKFRLRRLEESHVSMEEAMQACAHWGSEIMDCVLDVRTSGDVGVALNGPIAFSEGTFFSNSSTLL